MNLRILTLIPVLLSACSDGSGPSRHTDVPLAFSTDVAPHYRPLLRPITRIRLTAANLGSGQTVEQRVFPVDPAAGTWSVPLDVRIPDAVARTTLLVTLELIHQAGGVDVVEASGRSGPLNVEPGGARTVPIEIFPGPADYLDLTGVLITTVPARMLAGDTVTATASVSGGVLSRIYWSSSNPAVLSVAPTGRLTALAPGTAFLRAFAGPRADSVLVQVEPPPAG